MTHKKVKITPGFHEGMVKSALTPNNTVQVQIKTIGGIVPCVWAAGVLSGMLGFKTSYVPPMKTKVLVWIPDSSIGYIIGMLPDIRVDQGRQSRTVTGADKAYTDQQIFTGKNSSENYGFISHKPPIDMVEGELNIENLMGVGISLLRNLASLQAGDLARVECHVMDDMVRIISNMFRHHTAFGDMKISNDGGKLNVIWHGTNQESEAWGLPQDSQAFPKAATPSRTSVTEDLVDPNQNDDGRWRFSEYIGWLGNFVNLFVTDPVAGLGRIAENQFRSGKFRAHVNNDGSLLVQSVADIILERVVRIPVPIQIRKEDDPQGMRSEAELPNAELLQAWESKDIADMAFQLREYARWMNNTYSLARFQQMPRDYQVPSEDQTPIPQSSGSTVFGYSTIRIYRNGSIQTVDCFGNSVLTHSGGIQISSLKDILIQSAASINLVAGDSINMVARNDVSFTAVSGIIRAKAQTAWQMFCAVGNIAIETLTSKTIKFIGNLDSNDTASVDTSGNIKTKGSANIAQDIFGDTVSTTEVNADALNVTTVMATEINAVDVNNLDSFTLNNPLLQNIPVQITGVNIAFSYPDQYNTGTLYETMSQQQARKEKLLAGSWSFADNAVAGKGSPWPGPSPQHKTTDDGDSLNVPSTDTVFTATPDALETRAITLKI